MGDRDVVFSIGRRVSASVLSLTIGCGATAWAQTTLPEIVVTSPSPIVPRATPPTRPAASGPRSVVPAPSPEPVPVAAAPAIAPVANVFVPVTVVTAPELVRQGGGTLGDLLFDKPGITSSSFAPGAASRPIIRGLDNFRVRIQENGVASMDVSDLGEDHGVPIDPLAAQQIEVIRGPATLRLGSQAIGGVVSVTNNRIPDVLPERNLSVETRSAFTSVDRGNEGGILVDGRAGNVAFHADVYGRRAGDYSIPGYPYLSPPDPAPIVNGRQPSSALHSEGQAVGGSYFFDGGYVGVAVAHFASLYHVPGLDLAATGTRIDLEQTKITSKGEYRPQSGIVDAFRFWLGATDYRHDEIGLGDDGVDGVQATFKNRQQEARFEAQFVPWLTPLGALTGAVGAQLGHQNLGTSGEAGSLLAPTQSTSVAGYLFEELRLTDTIKVQAAGRIENDHVRGTAAVFPSDFLGRSGEPAETPQSRTFAPKSASLGLLKDLPWGVVASLNGQYVERAPRAPELFSKGAHDAPGTFEIGNPDLGIEVAKTVELGLRRAKGDWRFEVTAYYTRYSGFIYKALTGIRCGEGFASCGAADGVEFTQIVYSQRDATFYGVELSNQLDVLPVYGGIFGVEGQYDFVHATFNDGTNVPRIPPHRLGGGVYWRDANWFFRVNLLHAFAHDEIAANETPTDGYTLLRAELSYTRKLKAEGFGSPREITLGISGNNLLDEDIRNSVSFRKDEVLIPGRSFRLFANLKF